MPYKNELFINPIKNFVEKSIPFEIPQISFSTLGEDSTIIGACFMAVEALINGEFPYKIDQS